uniref:ankyrin repeat domain-containing protein 26-like isoform X3 n=1 Tax=Jaculus jaculus TaxID=51337 RepID=UPI001E1B35C1|nr:ankyrin repeat domain-containing protein 26-like isoform X3 [Jaculus jaculus]
MHLFSERMNSGNLLKIQDSVHSYKRVMQRKDSDCEVLSEKLKIMENQVSELQRKLTEAEHDRIKQEQELCNVRFALKQEEEKRKSADWVCEKIKEQLRERKEQYNKEVEMNQQLNVRMRELDVELKTVRNDFSQALDEQNDTQRQLVQHQKARILQDEILAKHLDKQKQLEMEQEKIRSKNADLTAELETTLSKRSHLHKENQVLRLELSAMNTTQKKCENLRKYTEKLKKEIVSLRRYMESNMVECSQIEQYKLEVEEQTKQDLIEKLKQVNLFLQTKAIQQEKEKLICTENASVPNQMELKIKDLESELSRMRSQVHANQIAIDNYKQLYPEEVKLRKSLSNKLSKTDASIAEVMTKLLLERQKKKSSQQSTLNARPAPELAFTGDLSNRVFIPRGFSGGFSRDNIVDPTSNLWYSIDIMHNYKTMVNSPIRCFSRVFSPRNEKLL